VSLFGAYGGILSDRARCDFAVEFARLRAAYAPENAAAYKAALAAAGRS
jgi:hypothetical protein